MSLPIVKQIPREEVPKDRILCEFCTAKCCRYIALPSPRNPKTWKDFDELRWFVSHRDVAVFVDDGDWYVMFNAVCRHLRDDHLCNIYDTRPQICRDYTTKGCEYDEYYLYEKIFETDEQLYEYAEALLGPHPSQQGRRVSS
jgi:uncharacterized protein